MPEMTNTSEILLARLAEGLDSTAKMTQALLSDLRDSEADFAAMKTELNILKENVKGLSEVVRDGGTSSILTRVALIEQSLDNIKKWLDNHVDVHQRMKKDFTEFRNQITEIERRLQNAESTLKQIEDDEKEREKAEKIAKDREDDFAHEQKKNDDKLRAERQSAMTKLITAVIIGVVGVVAGYFANSCSEIMRSSHTPSVEVVKPTPQSQSQQAPQSPVPASSTSTAPARTP